MARIKLSDQNIASLIKLRASFNSMNPVKALLKQTTNVKASNVIVSTSRKSGTSAIKPDIPIFTRKALRSTKSISLTRSTTLLKLPRNESLASIYSRNHSMTSLLNSTRSFSSSNLIEMSLKQSTSVNSNNLVFTAKNSQLEKLISKTIDAPLYSIAISNNAADTTKKTTTTSLTTTSTPTDNSITITTARTKTISVSSIYKKLVVGKLKTKNRKNSKKKIDDVDTNSKLSTRNYHPTTRSSTLTDSVDHKNTKQPKLNQTENQTFIRNIEEIHSENLSNLASSIVGLAFIPGILLMFICCRYFPDVFAKCKMLILQE